MFLISHFKCLTSGWTTKQGSTISYIDWWFYCVWHEQKVYRKWSTL